MLSKGTFLDLYVYGYDAPEGYAIEKDGNMFYAFYAPEKPGKPVKGVDNIGEWKGQVELRGLQARPYQIVDYVNNKDYGTVTEYPTARLNADLPAACYCKPRRWPRFRWENKHGNRTKLFCVAIG